jgi:hypothetical protein
VELHIPEASSLIITALAITNSVKESMFVTKNVMQQIAEYEIFLVKFAVITRA